jgi:serine/threonine-protein kinase
MRFTLDTVIAERYKINSFLGEGSFGEVYRAESPLHGVVALKMLPIDSTCGNPQGIIREASTMALMEHPNVVKFFEIGLHTDSTGRYGYIAMEYLAGGTLRSLLDEQVRVSVEQTLALGQELLTALAFAHSQTPPVIHGDIKPENVLLSGDTPPHAYLSDFGVAQLACEITGMASAAGTIFYMPPESLWGYSVPASDVFCVGMLLYTMLTGVSPFVLPDLDAMTDKERRQAVEISRRKVPHPPSTFNPSLENSLDRVILKALALDAKERYRDANEFLHALQLSNEVEDNQTFEPLSPYELYADVPPFTDDVYRELALSGSLSKAEVMTLWEFYCDFETVVALEVGGLFSPVTITGRTKTELAKLHGHSFSDWLFEDITTCGELRLIKDIGKQFWANPYSVRAQRVGKTLYTAAVALAKLRFGEIISSLSSEQLHLLCEDLLEKKSLPPKYRMPITSFRDSIG